MAAVVIDFVARTHPVPKSSSQVFWSGSAKTRPEFRALLSVALRVYGNASANTKLAQNGGFGVGTQSLDPLWDAQDNYTVAVSLIGAFSSHPLSLLY